MKKNSLTVSQAKSLFALGFKENVGTGYFYVSKKEADWFSVPTVDEVIDWLRTKHNIIIYNAIEPVIDPKDSSKILFRFGIKWCNKRDGWNGRVYIGTTKFTANVYSLKREAITKALRWLKQKQNGNKVLQKRKFC